MSLTTITNTLVNSENAPIFGVAVRASLKFGQFVGSTSEVYAAGRAYSGKDGKYSLSLQPNSEINPAGSWYLIKEGERTLAIQVPVSATPVNIQTIIFDPTAPVTTQSPVRSVNSVTPDVNGNVLLTKANLSLGSVDNTSDAAKPISTATQTALDLKSATGHTHVAANVTDFSTASDARIAAASVNALSDVDTATVPPTDGQSMVWVAASSAWKPATISGLDPDLVAIANLTPTDDDIIQRKAGAWTNRNVAAYKTDLGVNNVDNTSDATKNAAAVTLTNKTISGATNTLSAIAQSSVTNLTTDLAAKAPLASPTFTGTVTAPRLISPSVALTDAATIAVDASLGNYFRVILGGNRTLGAPTNPTNGQKIIVEVIQDATGTRTLAYNAVYAFGTDVPSPTLTTTANKRDFLGFIYNSTANLWYCLAVTKGY